MDLWNEYEGRSIAGLFPLERLIRPEGRSAFFSTSSAGTSTVIRLIESHFDEEEILARWTSVSDLHQPNLLTLTRFGQAMMDETSLVYVVMEPTEADLSQILCERPLTLAETRQIASSLVPALQALHGSGFIHEHIHPANVLAVGEVVKLRSDCIREAPEGTEGDALRSRDVQDLATLLLQCLTQQCSRTTVPSAPPLPAPFHEIIQGDISGTWDLARMKAALDATALPLPAAIDLSRPATPTSNDLEGQVNSPVLAVLTVTPNIASTTAEAALKDRQSSEASLPHRSPEPVGGRIQVPIGRQSRSLPPRIVLLALAAVCLLVFAAYAVFHSRSSTTVTTGPAPASETGQTPVSQPAASVSAAPPVPTVPTPRRPTASASRDEWRVIVFTYNKQAEANVKVRSLEQRFASLHPAVFTPTGRAPYLVTLGGALTRDAAFTLRNKLRGAGLPRDLYAQNYAAKSR